MLFRTGCGKTCILKPCQNIQTVKSFYVGCGERGNEMAEVLEGIFYYC